MSSRLTLISWTLDAIQRELEKRLGTPVALILRPDGTLSANEARMAGLMIMTEEGSSAFPLASSASVPITDIPLVWGLVEKAASPHALMTTSHFQEAMAEWRQKFPGKFPWFESLFSGKTLFHLERAGMSVPELTAMLNSGLMNPYSLEADETLAYEVLDGDDSGFSTLWVPLHLLTEASPPWRIDDGKWFHPFPGSEAPLSLPMTVFQVRWVGDPSPAFMARRAGAPVPFQPRHAHGSAVQPCSIDAEKDWKEHHFQKMYNALVSGRP